MNRRRRGTAALAMVAALVVAGQLAGWFRLAGSAGAVEPAAAPTSDFNGDGFEDLAIQVPRDESDIGAVNVVYGSANGLTAGGTSGIPANQRFSNGDCMGGEDIGERLAWGDFNGDGKDDLAVQFRQFFGGGYHDVAVLYGSSTGITEQGCTGVYQFQVGGDTGSTFDAFGTAMAAGDFDGDGKDDLAIGDPVEHIAANKPFAGVVFVAYGSADGLDSGRQGFHSQKFRQGLNGLGGVPQNDDLFGRSLAAGDFDGDGRMDLAIGVPGEPSVEQAGAGIVQVLYGSGDGLAPASPDVPLMQYGYLVPDNPEAGDWFGSRLAAGDFGKGPQADLAVGVEDEGIGKAGSAGAVNVIYGSPKGLADLGAQFFSLDTPGVGGTARSGDTLGGQLTTGDFDGDGHDDLAAAALFAKVGTKAQAGEVLALYGSATGLRTAGSELWTSNAAGDPVGLGDEFGSSLAAGRYDSGPAEELAVGVCFDDPGGRQDAGSEIVLYGTTTGGLSANGAQWWHQSNAGTSGESLQGQAHVGDGMGC